MPDKPVKTKYEDEKDKLKFFSRSDSEKVNLAIHVLEMAKKSFLYGYIQPNGSFHSAIFLGGSDFNFI